MVSDDNSINFFNILNSKKNKDISNLNFNIQVYFSCYLIFSSEIKIPNIFSIKERLSYYFYVDDKEYLSQSEKELINFLKPKLQSFECIQLFSNDAALYYLLRKKSCTKFYFVWSASSIFNQKKFINELRNVNFIITGGPKNDWDYPLEEKLHLVDEYIKKNFTKTESYQSWNILIRG